MKRMKTSELDREAEKIVKCWICQYGAKNANKLSLVVRRKFRLKKAVKPPVTSRRHLRGSTIAKLTEKVAG